MNDESHRDETSRPKYPRASTLAKPTVGAGGVVIPINDVLFPLPFSADMSGVKNGRGAEGFDNSVIVEGVRAFVIEGEGGNTNNVWEGVPAAVETDSVE